MYTSTKGQVPSVDARDAIRQVIVNGVPKWLDVARGRTFPIVAGGEDPPPAPKTEDPPKAKEGEGDDGDEFDKDRALATIRKLREGEKGLKAQLKELETLKAKQKERDDAEKSESEKLTAKIAELERKATAAEQLVTETRNRQAIERAAAKAGVSDPDDAVRLLDTKTFEIDDSGNLTNADDLVKALVKAKPYLAKAESNGTTTGVPSTPKGSDPQAISDEDRRKRAVGIRDIW